MNILDENIPKPQRELLERWKISIRQIGVNIGRRGMLDEEIISLLHGLRRVTFFTRDEDFYDKDLCHIRYCLVYLAVDKSEAALFIRRLLRHPDFRTQANRSEKVIRVSHSGISFWQRNLQKEHNL